MKKVFITSNGCPRRYLDASKLQNYFKINKCKIIKNPKFADYLLFISCSFTKYKELECIELIKKLSIFKGELIVMGCLPEISPEILKNVFQGKAISTKKIEKIDKIFPVFKYSMNKIKDTNVLFNDKYYKKFKILNINNNNHFFLNKLYEFFSNKLKHDKIKFGYKINLKVSKGCNQNCSYCSIKNAIGKTVSKPITKCVNEYKELIKNKHFKINLIADNIGSYGLDLKSSFKELLSKLAKCNDSAKIKWYIKDLHPIWLIKYETELKKHIRSGKISSILCPIQSGSQRILKLMNRDMDKKDFYESIQKFKKINPTLKLITQIIIGFPSETNIEFNKTLKFINKIGFDAVWVFPYHNAKNAPSAKMNYQINKMVINKRMKVTEDYLLSKKIVRYSDENFGKKSI
ncbi:radical SAM protein [Candidatus Woesearchaeota archaeon]|jgi:MiaB/RimO family radical SAM methylthiotransferase|nr:radical SAM protein [Candidatus Woesearchaeota archaeon]